MKEATGELNATVIVVIVVAMLVAFFYFTIWPVIENNMNENTRCSQAICNDCDDKNGNCHTVSCHLPGENEPFDCAWKG